MNAQPNFTPSKKKPKPQKKEPALPKSYQCKKCEKAHDFTAYVFSHWHEPLAHQCACGATHRILAGEAALVDV